MKKRWFYLMMMAVAVISLMGCGNRHPGSSSSSDHGQQTTKATQEENGVADSKGETVASDQELKSVEELWADALDGSLVEEEEVTPSGELTNAILQETHVVILEDHGDSCKVKISYPNVRDAFEQAFDALPEEVDDIIMADFYKGLQSLIEKQQVPVIEETLEVAILTDSQGNRSLEWTRDVLRAMSGGLSEVYVEWLYGVAGEE